MKITFLGSSHGVPEPHRQCSCTMIEVAGRIYFVDMGMMAIPELVKRGISVESVKGLFFTHMHGDHTNGLIPFADLCSWYYLKADPVVYLPRVQARDVISDWIKVTGSPLRELRYEPILPGVIYDDGFLKVTAIATQHCPDSFALFLEAEGKKALFTGDLKHPSVDFPTDVLDGNPDLIVCEAAHFPVTDYVPVFKDCACPRVCITHYSTPRMFGFGELQQALSGKTVFTSHDGLELTL